MTTKTSYDWHGCPMRYAATVLGDSWNLIILRELLFKGAMRYADLANMSEGISTNILASRLSDLQAEGLVEKRVGKQSLKHLEYALSEKGNALLPVFVQILAWSGIWDNETAVPAHFVEEVIRDPNSIKLDHVREMHRTIEGT